MDELLRNEKVNEVIRRILKNTNSELSIGIIKDNKTKIFNYNQNNNSYYDIGSISKVFTSLIILKASYDGLVSLDDTLDKVLPLKKGHYPSICELLSHKTGYFYTTPGIITIPRLFKRYAKHNLYYHIGKEKIIKAIERIGYRNNKYGYSDFAYALLCLVIEDIYKKSYQDVLNDFLKCEFGLKDIRVISDEIKRKDSYLGKKKVTNWVWDQDNPYIGAGGLCATISDMTNFIFKLMAKEDEYIKLCFALPELEQKHNYAFFLSKNQHVYYHVGGVGTFRSSLAINKLRKIGIIILCNVKGKKRGNVSYLNKMIYNYIRRNKIIINFDEAKK